MQFRKIEPPRTGASLVPEYRRHPKDGSPRSIKRIFQWNVFRLDAFAIPTVYW
jgi:hypothetical protein